MNKPGWERYFMDTEARIIIMIAIAAAMWILLS